MVSLSSTAKQLSSKRQDTTINTESLKISKQKNDASKKRTNAKLNQKNMDATLSRASNITGAQKSVNSDVSADEADDPQPEYIRRRSQVHSYAEKLSENEYKCNICSKVCHPN